MALKRETTAKIKELLGQNPKGLSITQIVRNIAINRNTAGRYLENLTVSGQVEMRQYGMAKIFRLAQRVPLSAMLSISSELIMLLDNSLRIIYANEPMYRFLGTTQEELYGKNIEFSPCVMVFDDEFEAMKKHLKAGLAGREWKGELSLATRNMVFSCRIAPAVFEEGQRGVSVLLEDITERKRAEHTIQESERQFRQLAENLQDMIDRHTPNGTCIYVSPSCKSILGYRPVELVGHSALEIIHPDDVRIIRKYKTEVTKKNPAGTVTYRAKHKDGHYIWLESSLQGIFDEKTGELLEIYGVTRDITDRIEAEEALRESEDRYRKLVEISPDAVILHRDDKILYMNPAALELLGFLQPGDVIGKSVLDLIHPAFRNAISKNIQKDIRGDRTPSVELQMLRADGTPIIVEGRGIRTFIGGRPAVQVAIRDITERKRAEEALRESEATARALLNAPTDSVMLLDTRGVTLELNETAARRLGRPKDELIGVLADSVLPQEVAQARRSIISQVIDTKEAVRFEDTRDGVWFDTVAYPVIGANGEVNRIAIIARDITDRKRSEEALRQSEGKLNAMLQSITDPISMMDENLTLIWSNDTAKRYFGKDIVGKKCYDAFHQRQNPCEPYPCLTLKAFQDGKIHRHETTVIDMQGKTRFFDCTAKVALIDKTGKPTAVLEISRDITEWKLAEEALQKRS